MAGKQPRRVLIAVAAIEIAAAVIAAPVIGLFFYGTVTKTVTSTTTSTTTYVTTVEQSSTVCEISGETGPLYLRFLFDTNQTPAAGALVAATNQPFYCGSTPATNQTTLVFSTNHTEWYLVNTNVNAAYSVVVGYYGQVYHITVDMRPVSVTCATLWVPSGRTNVTAIEFQSSCP